MKISSANRRTSKKWVNQDITWSDFLDRLRTPVRTTETVAEFARMSRAKQDDIKDVGGFVGGFLRGGKRRNGWVAARYLLTLDMDFAKPGVWEDITLEHDWRCCVYSTHKHTPEAPRLRLVIQLSRKVSEEEYPAVARMVAHDIGIDMFDDTTYEPSRLMYWPSCSSNGEYIFEEQDGGLLDPDEYLARYDDWHDVTQWPTSSRQSEIVKRDALKLADPREKDGLVGAFCRAYGVQEAIEKFLPEIYAPNKVRADRYDYLPGKATAGLTVFSDDVHAYSYHDSDPAHGHALNAFDLVRIHLFPEDGDEKKSNSAMLEMARKDKRVKLKLFDKNEPSAADDFRLDGDAEDSRSIIREIHAELTIDHKDRAVNRADNFVTVIEKDPKFRSLRYNEFSQAIEFVDTSSGPCSHIANEWTDNDDSKAQVYIEKEYGIWGPLMYRAALISVVTKRSFHPVKEYLNSLEWDGTPRIDTLLIDYLGAKDRDYVRAVTRKTLIAAVARIFEPGVKFDTVLVLCGPQGIGKSTLFAKLGKEWYSDSVSLVDMRNDSKTAPEKLQGRWILELSELAGIKKTEENTVKSFLSTTEDRYRAPFERRAQSHKRQCILVGTTNRYDGFLRDDTGNRRFWPVNVTKQRKYKAWNLSGDDVNQFWAEAVVAYKNREKLILTGELVKEAKEQQREAVESDPREGDVRLYLNRRLPEDWLTLSMNGRIDFLNSGKEGTQRRESVSVIEIWCECFFEKRSSIRNPDKTAIRLILERLKWTSEGGKTMRRGCYGPQYVWQRPKKEDDTT